jgi:hypothetical protein
VGFGLVEPVGVQFRRPVMEGQRKTYRAWDARQNSQDSVSPRLALPKNELVLFLIDLIPQLDMTAFHEHFTRELRGQPPFDVTMMVTLLVYAYAVAVCPSRRRHPYRAVDPRRKHRTRQEVFERTTIGGGTVSPPGSACGACSEVGMARSSHCRDRRSPSGASA